MADSDIHTPVLLERCVELLQPALKEPGAVLLDATLGMAGHAEAFLSRCPELVFVGLDRDQDALDIAGRRLAGFGERVHLVLGVVHGERCPRRHRLPRLAGTKG